MELEQLAKKMEEDGYQRIASNVEQITLFLKREGEKTCGVCLVDDRTGILDGSAMFETVMKKTEEKLKDGEHDLLALIVTNDVEREKLHQQSPYAFWLLDAVGGRRIVFERQPIGFHGLEGIVEDVLDRTRGEWAAEAARAGRNGAGAAAPGRQSPYSHWAYSHRVGWKNYLCSVNTVIILLNVVMFVWMELSPEGPDLWRYRHGALYVGGYFENPELWRNLASAFIHFDFVHIFSNMLVLWFTGRTVESFLGWWRYALLYLVSILGSDLVSLLWYWWVGRWNVVTAGASGAVFGVVGMLLFIMLYERGRNGRIPPSQILILIFFILYAGSSSEGVNHSAHLGGLLTGFLSGALFYRGPVRSGARRPGGGKR